MTHRSLRILAGAAPRADGSPEGVNLSQLVDWARCRYRWHLRHRRQIDRRSLHIAMDRGSATHAGIAGGIRAYAELKPGPLTKTRGRKIAEGLLNGVAAFAKEHREIRGNNLTPEETAELDQLCQVSQELAARALNELDLQRWEIIRIKGKPVVELKLSMPFLPGIDFYGTADVAWKDRADRSMSAWVADWKVRDALQPIEHEEVDLQLPAYQKLLAHHGILTVGSIKFQIRGELPRQPERNKDGKMSRARIATTWDVYKQALIQAGLNPAHYIEEMKPKLDVPFFKLDRLFRNQFYINNVWDQIILPMGKQWAKSKVQFRNMHFMNCSGCWAREFCQAELRGEDVSFLLDTTYMNANDPRARMVLKADDFDFEE